MTNLVNKLKALWHNRNVQHFVVVAVGAYAALWAAAGHPTSPKALWALVPAAAVVIFRKLFPGVPVLTKPPAK